MFRARRRRIEAERRPQSTAVHSVPSGSARAAPAADDLLRRQHGRLDDVGSGSLRAAILAADADTSPGTDEIVFAIPA